MPKVKVSQKTKLQLYQREFEGEMIATENRNLYCRACEKAVCCEKRLQVLQHFNTNIHKENGEIKSMKSIPVQKLLSEFYNNSFSQFSFDLCEALLAADIPLWNLTSPTLIRDKIQDNFVWVSIDGTQNYEARFIGKTVESINKNEQLPVSEFFYRFNFRNRNVVNTFDPKSAASIQFAQDVLKNAEIETNLSYISAHFSHLPSAISSLEASNSNTTFYQSLSVFRTTVSKLNLVPGRVGEVVKEGVHSILLKKSRI
ncbi:hypothetical protein B7P43_G06349 [Cryptotermes secundus]|uniref:Uncharacterized protein n=1 Tax=Cryptotermes secundus TaxID=105785 RepID=A0A2J7QBN0_9NEOP|nr:hypothetical protein B7P43_G06349 [Cryptotermes secundus]